jgi:polyphosphate kinase
VYAGSADFMPRNLNRRVEILFPVENPKLVRRLRDDILQRYLDDNCGSWLLDSDGVYRLASEKGKKRFESQSWFVAHHGG